MALPIPGDRAAETSTTTGTGTYALIGSITGWQTLVAACGSGVEVDYFVRNPDVDADYEVGRGTTGAGTLTRDTIYASSNAGAAVNWAAGTKEVVVTLTANAMAQIDTALSTSAGLAAYVSDETGTGSLVFGTQPTLTHPVMASEAEPTPASGMMYVDSTTNKLRCYEKGNWSDVLSFTEQGTGLVTGGVLSIGTPTSTFSISDGSGFAVDHTTVPGTPTTTPVSWTGKTNITVTNLATALITFVGIDATGTVIQQTGKFSNAQRRDIIVLGVIVHVDNISVNTVNNEQHAAINVVAQVHDLAEAIGFINIFGNIFSQGGTGGLYIQKSAGDVFGIGSNWANSAKNPNVLTLAAEDDIGFQYRTLLGNNRNNDPAAELVIDPNIWDNAGTLTTVATNKWTAQRVYVFLSGAVKIQAGQEECATASACIDSLATGNFITEPSIVANGLLRGFIIVQEGETNLANATFIEAEKFGSSTGSGAATGSEFTDSLFRVYDDADPSKQIAVQASGITTGTTRTITMPDNDVNLGIDFEPADATIVKDADIGVTVQPYNATTVLDADVTYELLNTNGDVGTGAGQLAIGNHLHTGVYEPADATILKDADIGVTVLAPSGDGSGLTGIPKSPPARNAALNQDPVSQGESTRTGMSSTIYTGNGTSQSVATGVDMATGDLGGLVWVKNRDAADGHVLSDSIRGVTKQLATNATTGDITDTDRVTSFDTNGFGIGADVKVNTNLEDYVAWSFQTNKKTTGTTNRNKAYTAHYNTDMGFSIVGYVGDGVNGHEIPHHLGVEPELSIFKNRDSVYGWIINSSLFANDEYLEFTTAPLATSSNFGLGANATTFGLGTSVTYNALNDNIISYHFASVPGVSKVGKYIGTGAVGNYVDCGFKPAFVMVKNLTSAAGNWVIWDGIRSTTDVFDDYILPNSSGAETTSSATVYLNISDDGFAVGASSGSTNALNDEYLFLAFAETSTDATKAWADYSYPTTADTLSIAQNTLMSFANGFNAIGQLDTQENVGAGVTYALGVGHENKHYWLYKIKAGAYGVSEYRPLEGITRNDADKWGEESPLDATLRTTAKHFDYESSTGVALASGELAGAANSAYNPFAYNPLSPTELGWYVSSITTSWLQYKFTEKRILKSWRLRQSFVDSRAPRLFTIEGSNDGFTWTAIDSTYTASDYVGNGAVLWGDLQSTSGNTTAYLYHRINITANNGHATLTGIGSLEFNTILPSDYYLVEEGKMYNSAGTPIERVYLAELMTDSDGDVSWYRNLATAKQKFSEVDIYEDLTVHGKIKNRGVATAWVNFDSYASPPIIKNAENVKDIVDLGVGIHKIIFKTPMDNLAYTLSGAQAANSGAGSVYSLNEDNYLLRSVNYVIVHFGYVNATANYTLTDNRSVSVVVFGGKD